jgi:hypothetical protein
MHSYAQHTVHSKMDQIKNISKCPCAIAQSKSTDIYPFPSGLDTTDLFQIQASTEDSKKTYSEDRLFSALPLPSALPHM